jgi:DNA-binding beta-propeller fold protein YncE
VLIVAGVLLAAGAGDGAAKGGGPTSFAAGFGSVWIGMGNGDVLRLDAQTGRQQARLRSGHSGFVHALAVGYGALWVVRDRVARIDPGHRLTLEIPGTASGTAFAIAVGAGSVWVADDGANEILRIAPKRAKLIAGVDVPGRAWGVAAGRESVIVISVPTNGPVSGPDGSRLLRRLNPKTNELSRPLARLTCDAGVAVTSRAVWTLDACTGVLARRDPRTLEVRRERAMHVLSQTPVFAFGSLWLARRGGTLRVDPTTLRVRAVIPARSVAVAVGAGFVWAFDAGGPQRRPALRRIDPRTNRVIGSPVRFAKETP